MRELPGRIPVFDPPPYAYCKPHSSHFCPCLKPHLYNPDDPQDRKYIAGWEDIAPIVVVERHWVEREPSVNDTALIPDDEWAKLEVEAAEKDEYSKKVHWTRVWTPDFNLKGKVGEWLYEQLTGIPRKRTFGDGGTDFPGVDVKCSGSLTRPVLRRPPEEKLRALFYVLVGADMEQHLCRYVGYATREEMASAPVLPARSGTALTRFPDELEPTLPEVPGDAR